MTTRRIVFAVFPGFQILDLTGPHEVFTQAARLVGAAERKEREGAEEGLEEGTDEGPEAGEGPVRTVIDTVAAAPGPVPSSGGLAVSPTLTTDQITGPVDTLVAVGGSGVRQAGRDPEFVRWFAETARRARRTASVCNGAFLLGAAGLLDGRRATTHWSVSEELAARFPRVTVDPDRIFVRDGELWTSAGVTAGIDLALAMVEADHGPEIARTVARRLVMFVQRPGGQAQFSNRSAARPDRAALREVAGWIAGHLGEDLGVPVLAARAGMSERNFTRLFRAETGHTPAAYVESARIEAARRLLESTQVPLEAVARRCGFGTVETLHRSFKRCVRVTPAQYRRHFAVPSV